MRDDRFRAIGFTPATDVEERREVTDAMQRIGELEMGNEVLPSPTPSPSPSEPAFTAQPKPSVSQAPAPAKAAAVPSKSAAKATPKPKPASEPAQGDVSYANCAAAWAAGAAPLHRGDPGYRPKLDRDGDGVACEKRPRK